MSRFYFALLSIMNIDFLCGGAKSSIDYRKRLNDSIFDGGTRNNKAFLKNTLLENLNNYFPSSDGGEKLELLSGDSPSSSRQQIKQNSNEMNQFFSNFVTEPVVLDNFPTLIPNVQPIDPQEELNLATAPSTKIRSEGRITDPTLDNIRNWRKKLYKAFQNRSKINRIIRKSTADDGSEMNDEYPVMMDKNRQIIMNRKDPKNQYSIYGREADDNLTPMFAYDPNIFQSQKTIEPYPAREIRLTYRTSNGQPVVYIPAASPSQPEIVPVPVASYLVTATPPPPPPTVQLRMIAPPSSLPSSTLPPFLFGQNGFLNGLPTLTQQTTTQIPFSTWSPADYDNDLSSNEIRCENNGAGQCSGGGASASASGFLDDKCNSKRLQIIIFNNIVNGNAEASKRAVQSAAEAETGQFFDAICGTGFFSYIAHTDEFCLASSGGVNCYVFSPICQEFGDEEMMKKKKRKRKAFLNRN